MFIHTSEKEIRFVTAIRIIDSKTSPINGQLKTMIIAELSNGQEYMIHEFNNTKDCQKMALRALAGIEDKLKTKEYETHEIPENKKIHKLS